MIHSKPKTIKTFRGRRMQQKEELCRGSRERRIVFTLTAFFSNFLPGFSAFGAARSLLPRWEYFFSYQNYKICTAQRLEEALDVYIDNLLWNIGIPQLLLWIPLVWGLQISIRSFTLPPLLFCRSASTSHRRINTGLFCGSSYLSGCVASSASCFALHLDTDGLHDGFCRFIDRLKIRRSYQPRIYRLKLPILSSLCLRMDQPIPPDIYAIM